MSEKLVRETFEDWMSKREGTVNEFAAGPAAGAASPEDAEFGEVWKQMSPVIRRMGKTNIDPAVMRVMFRAMKQLERQGFDLNDLPQVLSAVVNVMIQRKTRNFMGGASALGALKRAGAQQMGN